MNRKYWLRGGAIATIIVIVISLLGILIRPFGIILIPGILTNILIDELLIGGTMKNPTFPEGTLIVFSVIFSILIYFTIGAFFGWIYGKIKNRNKVI